MNLVRPVSFAALCVGLPLAMVADNVNQSASMPLRDHLHAFAVWAARHPSFRETRILLPSIDLYDNLGRPIYHGDDPERNAKFLDNYPAIESDLRNDLKYPSLEEALSLVPGLVAHVSTPVGIKHTIFSTTVAGCQKCREQDAAVIRLKERAGRLEIRVLDLTLMP